MSEQVESSPVPPPAVAPPASEILPAKSEDKLEIEKEENEKNQESEKEKEEKDAEPVNPETAAAEADDKDKPSEKEEGEKDEAAESDKPKEEKKEASSAEGEAKKEEGTKEEAEEKSEEKDDAAAAEGSGDASGEKKKFKIPNVQIKTPKMPGFLRSKSKDRKKESEDGDDKKQEEAAGDDSKKKEEETEGAAAAEATGEDANAETSTAKDAKTKVKEAMENIHLPKMPKIHKPAFLKKAASKKEGDGSEETPAESKEDEEGKEKTADAPDDDKDKDEAKKETDEGKDEKKEEKEEEAKEETKETEGEEAAATSKGKKSIIDSLKNIKSQVPAFLAKKGAKDKDVEAADNEEAKELLDKKEEDKSKEAEEEGKKDGAAADGEAGEDKADGDAAEPTATSAQQSRGAALLESLRSVASHVPTMFKKQKEKEPDVEAGEKDELLEKSDNKKADGELEEVKVNEEKKDPDAASIKSEKKDPEKDDGEGVEGGDGGDKKKPPPLQEHLDRAKAVGDQCVQRFGQLDQTKKVLALAVAAGVLLVILIIAICAAAAPSDWSNEARMVDGGKYVETHSSCGPIQGIVDGPNQFSFTRIPYAASTPLGTNRWKHSTAATDLADCHNGTMIAHSHNKTKAKCWRRYPKGTTGDEDCLTLDIYTSAVVYNQLMPVVVYVDGGDDLDAETEDNIQPSSELAKNQSVVFVSVSYRRGIFGFLSLDSLSGRAYPNSSGNYGLGDIIAALKWIQLNIQHFGGHPAQVTLLGRGEGATLVTTLTAAPAAKSLFKQAWVTNAAGVLSEKELDQANSENRVIFDNSLNCGSDEASCLIDYDAEDLAKSVPFEWSVTRQRKLPQQGDDERGHSWVIVDKHILKESPVAYWQANKLSNAIPIVFGATAQGMVSEDNRNFMNWTDKNAYQAHVESKLGSFNNTIPEDAMEHYDGDNWVVYASMLTDIRRVCPLQELAKTAAANFEAKVYSYVATQPRSKLGDIADSTGDIEAILGVYELDSSSAEQEQLFVDNMQHLFYSFVRSGRVPQDKDVLTGMYTVNDQITTHAHYRNCDFWKSTKNIVPSFADFN